MKSINEREFTNTQKMHNHSQPHTKSSARNQPHIIPPANLDKRENSSNADLFKTRQNSGLT